MTRRQWLQWMALAPLMVKGILTQTAYGQETKRPNVLFIAIDDLNDWISILHGHPDVKTPNFDRLAKQGVVFNRAYTPGPVCNVARTALLSGLYPHKTGIYTNQVNMRLSPVLAEHITLPTYFRQNGYRVVCGGKVFHEPRPAIWHESYMVGIADLVRGIDLPLNDGSAGDRKQEDVDIKLNKDWGVVNVPEEELVDSKVVAWAIDQLNQNQEEPLFLAVGLRRPHGPLYTTQKYFDLYPSATLPAVKTDDLADIPAIAIRDTATYSEIANAGKWEEAVGAYLACISYADAKLGALLDGLEQSPRANNTLIVLWSDHGFMLGQKEHWGKGQLWEECLHVPLIFAGLESIVQNEVSSAIVSTLDIYKTLIELCGLPTRHDLDGQSLVPLLQNPAMEWVHPTLSEFGFRNFSVRDSQWHYIRYSDNTEELYNHQDDRYEWTNLAQDEQYQAIKDHLSLLIPASPVPAVIDPKSQDDPEA